MAFEVGSRKSIRDIDMQLCIGVYAVTISDYVVIAGKRQAAFVYKQFCEVLIFAVLSVERHAGLVGRVVAPWPHREICATGNR